MAFTLIASKARSTFNLSARTVLIFSLSSEIKIATTGPANKPTTLTKCLSLKSEAIDRHSAVTGESLSWGHGKSALKGSLGLVGCRTDHRLIRNRSAGATGPFSALGDHVCVGCGSLVHSWVDLETQCLRDPKARSAPATSSTPSWLRRSRRARLRTMPRPPTRPSNSIPSTPCTRNSAHRRREPWLAANAALTSAAIRPS